MNKWLSNIITTLVILSLTSLVGAVLKGPIDDFANRNRLKAQVQLAPWIEKPDAQLADAEEPSPIPTHREILDQLLDDLQAIRAAGFSASEYGVARINIENDSDSTVTNINLRIDAPYGEQEAVLVADNKAAALGEVSRILIPDMEPGDRVVVYLWGNYSTYVFPDALKTYSSEGAFRTSFDWPRTQEFEYRSAVAQFLDDWMTPIGIISFFLLLFALMIAAAVYYEYAKNLLKVPLSYKLERERFLENPKKFAADFTGVATAAQAAGVKRKREQKKSEATN